MIRVAVADDHALVREGLKALFATVDGIELVAAVETAAAAVQAVHVDRPDVLVLDINLPDGSGIEVCRQLSKAAPSTAVLMLTMFEDDQSVVAAMRAGARGYVLKGADPEDVLTAIVAVSKGNAVFGRGIAVQALAGVTGEHASARPFPQLTAREQDILALIATGVANGDIAQRLHLSVKTVSNHITAIYDKLHVATRAEAIARARDAGVGAPG